MIAKLARYVGKHKWLAMITPIIMMGEVFMEIWIPKLMGSIINEGIWTGSLPAVLKYGGIMVAASVISLACGSLAAKTAAVASAGFAANLRGALFHKIQDFSFANVDKFSTASLVTRSTTDVNNLRMCFQMSIRMLVRAPLMLVAGVVMAISIDRELALIFAVAIPVLTLLLALVGRRAFPLFRAMLDKFDRLNASVQENLTGIRVVKAFVKEQDETEKFRAAAEDVRAAQVRAEKLLLLTSPGMMLIINSCILAVYWFGGRMIILGDLLPGDLISFVSYVGQVLSSLMMITMSFIMFTNGKASGDRVLAVLEEKVDIDDAGNRDIPVADGSVQFEDVCFSYTGERGKLALDHISLSIASGETVGILGGTGCGKSTLVQMIPRLYDPLSGTVRVGGVDVRQYRLETLREEVAMVLQKNTLFSGTILDNLRWGDGNATLEQVREACRAAQADEFVMSFPKGYDTELGQGGVNLSGGQKQRLCIARALLKKPKIVILDDSTSAVDTATDAKIRAAFREQLRDTTTIIIAQRISSVMDADRILVMDKGAVADFGTHEQLMARCRIYQEVYESQQKGVED